METGNLTAKRAVIGLEELEYKGMLYDFYGELLTEHQKRIYEDFVCNDLSLGEIAEEQGISRQGVHDLVKRCDRLLLGYEEKLHLLERFRKVQGKIEQIRRLTMEEELEGGEAVRSRIRELSDEILEEL